MLRNSSFAIGVIGLGVMGANLARNFASRKISTLVYNRTTQRTTEFLKQFRDAFLSGEKTLKRFVTGLERPRKIILMVKAGEAVDDMIASLKPLLQSGDIIVDGGNSHYRDTMRREAELKKRNGRFVGGLYFVGCGISGGEEGALCGPSLMPGGDAKAYKILAPFFKKIAARDFNGKPCVTHIGPDGSGHYVKMIHNAIEYGMMQLLAESYDLLQSTQNMEASDFAKLFKRWNRGPLKSFLVESATEVFAKKDEFKKGYAIDFIQDRAEQKGTGQWAAIDALERGIAVPSLIEAVSARTLSSQKALRTELSRRLAFKLSAKPPRLKIKKQKLLRVLHSGLYAGFWLLYGQGFFLLAEASREQKWGIDLAEIARIWQGGCIIRADILKKIEEKFSDQKQLLSPQSEIQSLRWIVSLGASCGIPLPVFSSTLAYFDGITQKRGPANLIQALRDSFGSHTFERIDRPGHFHVQWTDPASGGVKKQRS